MERRWTINALRNLIIYFWPNIELTLHEYSFMSQITNYKVSQCSDSPSHLEILGFVNSIDFFKVNILLTCSLFGRNAVWYSDDSPADMTTENSWLSCR